MGSQGPKLNRMQKRQAREKANLLLPRCLATDGTHVCERELGHGNGWKHDKHKQGGFSWTDAYAEQVLKGNRVSVTEEKP